MNLFDLTGRIAVVAGASSGLGADAALAYAESGADVVLLARRIEKLKRLQEQIAVLGRRVLAFSCDVTNEQQVKETFDAIFAQLGRVDILLNSAGIAIGGSVETLTEQEWDRVFDTNVKGIFLTCKQVLPQMKRQRYGKIVNIASINAINADKEDNFVRHAYNASKAAVLGLTNGMAGSYAKYGITVNAIGPALFETEMTAQTLFQSQEFLDRYNRINPTGRPGKRGELNGTILYLSSDASSYVQAQFILVDGGRALV